MDRLEFKINIKETQEKHIDGLILGLVYSGYNAYLDYDKENVCFNGYLDEVVTQEIEEVT